MRLLPALCAACVAAPVFAHDVYPNAITLRPGGEDYVFVADQGICPADITITSTNPNLVKVYAIDMTTGAELSGSGTSASVQDRVTQIFVVRAAAGVTSATTVPVDVCWIGSDYPSPPCNENNCNPAIPHVVGVTVDPNPTTSGATLACGMARDPINTSNGEMLLVEEPDLDLGGPLPLYFRRYYASRLLVDGEASSTLGPNWLHNFSWKLRSVGNNVEVVTDTGRVIRFERGYFDTLWSLAVIDDVPYQLVQSGSNFTLADPLDGMRYAFDAQGRLTQIADGRGNALTLSYGGTNLASVSDGLGRTLTFVHSSGHLTSVSDGTRSEVFTYDGSNRLATARSPELEITTYSYDAAQAAAALLSAVLRPLGNVPTTQTYDGQQRVATQADAFNHVFAFAYGANNVTTITDPLGHTQVHDHDSDGELTSWKDEAGASAALQNDAKGRRTGATDRLGRTSSWTIHAPSGKLAQVTEADGARTTYGYTARSSGGFSFHDLTSITHADGRSESFAHDASGNVTTWTDRAGEDWSYTYDAHGQVLTQTNPRGGVTTHAYNADGTLASSQDDAGNATTFGYDALKRLVAVTHPDLTTRSIVYDLCDRVLSVTDEESAVTGFAYDDNGNLVTIVDPSGQDWSLCYDSMDRRCGNSDPLGHGTSATFDELGRLASATDATGNTTQLGYDARGRITSLTDELGHSWPAAYDAEGIATSLADPLGNANLVASNAMGRITKVTSPLGNETSYGYDAKGRLTTTVDPAGGTTRLVYDARGLLSSIAMPKPGASATLARDANGALSSYTPPGGSAWQYAHDAQGRLTSATDPLGRTTSFGYDERSRVDSMTFPGTKGTASYEYDDVGRLTRRVYSDGTDIAYGYDAAGRLTSTDGATFGYDTAGRIAQCNGKTMTHDDAGRLASVTFAPGKTVTYGYDERGLCTSLTDWLGGVSNFEYDDGGRLTRITRPNSTETQYQYDADGHVTHIQEIDDDPLPAPPPGALGFEVSSDIAFSYNSRGFKRSAVRNVPLSAKPALGDVQFEYDGASQVQGWSYDESGDALSDHTHFWTNVDLGGRVEFFREDGVDHDLLSDGLDRLISLGFGGETYDFDWNYGYDGIPGIDEMDWGSGSAFFVHTPDGAVFCQFDVLLGTFSYFHFDEEGSTLFRTGPDGEIVARYSYDELGTLLQRDDVGYEPYLHRARDGDVSLGSGRFAWSRGQRPFDTCTQRSLIRNAFDSWRRTPYEIDVGANLTGKRELQVGGILDKGWKPSTPGLDLDRYSVKGEWSLKGSYRGWPLDGSPSLGSAPAPDTSGGASTYADYDLSTLDLDHRFHLGRQMLKLAPEPPNHRQVLLKFKAARVLANLWRPRKFGERLTERALRLSAIATWQSMVSSDPSGISVAALVDHGPSVLRGALQEPEIALFGLGANVPLLADMPLLGNLFSRRGAVSERPALSLMLTSRIALPHEE